jgi:uncharacterized SAM-binding protein YcdF (DUF218 family)
METIIREFFWWLMNPSMLIILLIFIGMGFLFLLKNPKRARSFILSACSLVLFFGIIPTGLWVLENLENRFPQPTEIPADTTGIILLGGSFDRETSAARNIPAYNLAAGRFIEFIAFARKHPNLKRVFSGGGRPITVQNGSVKSEAELTKETLESIGFDTTNMIFEGESVNTLENARKTKELVKPTASQKWILMTSAFHMPRSVGLFRKAGWNVIPYPVDYHTPGGYELYFFLGLKDGLTSWHYAIWEWASMIQNYLFERSDELYPGPYIDKS